jgi:hypothetical protein
MVDCIAPLLIRWRKIVREGRQRKIRERGEIGGAGFTGGDKFVWS